MHPRHNITRYLSEGLPPKAEARLRGHLRTCGSCRSCYDGEVILLRALARDPDTATAQETDRMVRLALRKAGLSAPEQTSEERPGLLDRLLWAPAPVATAAAVLLALLVAVSAWFLMSPTEDRPRAPVVVARILKARYLTVDGVPVDPKRSPRAAVYAREKLEVGRGGIAELSLERGGTVRVFPDSALSLSGSGERLDLESGRVWCLMRPGDEPFVVRTDIAEAFVIGTSFVVERRRSGVTEVRVMSGVVEVRNVKKKKAVWVRSGLKTRVAPDKAPSPPSRYNPRRDRSDWARMIRRLSRVIKRAVKRVRGLIKGR